MKDEQKKNRNRRRGVAILLAVAMTGVLTTGVAAQSAWPTEAIYDIRPSRYESIPVTVPSGTGWEIGQCYLIHETTYAPLRAFSDAVTEGNVTYDEETRTAHVEAEGLTLTAQDGAYYLCANGRYLYTATPIRILEDGRMYVPIRLLARAFGVEIEWNAQTRSVRVLGEYNPILSGDAYYDEEDLYWLSRIISAESQGESLLGQIAVGNVVMNRASHPEYPDTIREVIFDRQYGTQFTPVDNGKIYDTPYYLSVIAAKLCLEGVTVSDEVLFFYAPAVSTSFWIPENREYAFSIGHHDFHY